MRVALIVSILLVLITSYLLVIGSDILVWALFESPYVPFGTFLTWIGLIALSSILFFGARSLRKPAATLDKFYRALTIIAMSLAVLWYPVIWLLADNLSASFGGNVTFRGSARAGEYFWNYTYFSVGLSLAIILSYGIVRLLGSFKSKAGR